MRVVAVVVTVNDEAVTICQAEIPNSQKFYISMFSISTGNKNLQDIT